MPPEADAVLEFWFSGRMKARWFHSTPELDQEIRNRFESLWEDAAGGRLAAWSATARGALALVIMLDQLPLNMFRGSPESFSTEAASREVANEAIGKGLDEELAPEERAFLYMPFMHSESLEDQDRSMELFSKPGLQHNLTWARHHREIIARFGRFPHRNEILNRTSSPEEKAWLQSEEGYGG
jgi:uncharacterized protein (DUF924 family)